MIWNNHEWSAARAEAKHNRSWYNADPLQVKQPRRDRASGNEIRQFPLDMNMVKLGCDLHRDLARGMTEPGDLLAISTSIRRGEDAPNAALVERILNQIWTHSYGGAIQQEGLLHMNVYGGCAYQIHWEPWNIDLPMRLAVRLHTDPSYIFPVWSHTDHWSMLQCHVGYEIDPDVALIKYGIDVPDGSPALYMEEWTRSSWEVRINGQVPTISWNDSKFRLSGKNPWGFVPIVYIPHERTTASLGDSAVTGTEELTKHINARAGTLSDLVQSTRPGLLTSTDVSGNQFVARPITVEGSTVAYVIDLGKTQVRPGSERPRLEAMPIVDIPPGLVAFPRELMDYWMMLMRIAPASFGLDDTQSGRITGPAIQARMFTSMAHAATERMNYTTGKTLLDRRIIHMLAVQKEEGLFDELGITPPDITRDDVWLDISQTWPTSLPLDRKELLEGLILRLQAYGISIEEFLRALNVKDIDGERDRILSWIEDTTELENKFKQGAQDGPGADQPPDRGQGDSKTSSD